MIDVNKYKLDDESYEEDSMIMSQSFKAKKTYEENLTNSNTLNDFKNTFKYDTKNINNKFPQNQNFEKEGNNTNLKKFNGNPKYLIDESSSKIYNENDTELNQTSHLKKQNLFLYQSNAQEDFIGSLPNQIEEKKLNKFNINNNFMDISNNNIDNNPFPDNFTKQNNLKFQNFKNFETDEKILELRNFNDNEENEFNNFNKNQNFHHVQIIDEDVENFKRKIDILAKNFKTDSLKDFMGIKRNLLLEQKNIIDSEKQKCDALVGAKTDQIEHLKDCLGKTKNFLSKEIEIKEKLSFLFCKYKINRKNNKMKADVFGEIKKYYIRKKINKKVNLFLKKLFFYFY